MNKYLLNIKKTLSNQNVQTVISFFICTWVLSFVIILIFFKTETVINEFSEWLFCYIISLIAFIPAYIVIYFLFKCIKETFLRIFSIAFFIPFFNLLYFYLESFMSVDTIYYTCILGALWLFVILPCMLITAIILPKSFLKMKTKIIITIILTITCGWSLIALIIPIGYIKTNIFPKQRTWIWNPIRIHQLEDYRPAIDYIENYRLQHGQYPIDITAINPISSSFPYYNYATHNNGNDFILSVSEYKDLSHSNYKYCSSPKLSHCTAVGYGTDMTMHFKLGDWVYYKLMFD